MKKKLFPCLALALLITGLAGCKNNKKEDNPTEVTKHLILNADGSYGGTTDLNKYGEGTPLNGEFDHLNSEYYTVDDYFNMKATSTRSIYTHYMPYQQTMANSDGIANVLSVLNYLGKDMNGINEVSLVNKYEELNQTTVYGNGTSAEGLQKLLNSYGVESDINVYAMDTSIAMNLELKWLSDFLESDVFDEGYILMVKLTDVNGFSWHTIVGMDNIGTYSWARDDQVILMDSYDVSDHYQDGYNVMALGRMYRWWEEVKTGRGKGNLNQFECVLVKPDQPIQMVFDNNQTSKTQVAPQKHLILNADGSYGGTLDTSKYGDGTPKNGQYDAIDTNYCKFVDYYNMECNDTRLIMKNFMPYQQTMASSCTLCSLLVVFNYYGEDIVNIYSEVALVECYERLNNTTITYVGCGCDGRMKMFEEYGFEAFRNTADIYNENFLATYNDFKDWCWDIFSKDMPIPISWTPIGDHGEVLIGIETMGTDFIYDDVIILADSSDTWDLYQDGYNTVPAVLFYNQWFEGLDGNLSSQSFNYFYRKAN